MLVTRRLLAADLQQEAGVAVLDEEHVGAPRAEAAVHLAPHHGHLVLAAVVAGKVADVQLQRVDEHGDFVEGRAARAGAGELYCLLDVAQLVEGVDVVLDAGDDGARVGRRLADEGELGEVELDSLASHQLGIDEPGVERPDGEPVGLGGINLIGADDMAGAGHVLDDDPAARQVLGHVLGDQPAIGVVTAAGRRGDDIGDGLALEEVGPRLGQGGLRGHGDDAQGRKKPVRNSHCLVLPRVYLDNINPL